MVLDCFAQLLRANERGQDAAEYSLLIALIAIVIIGAVTLMGGNLASLFVLIAGSMP